MKRGSFEFQGTVAGDLADAPANLETLRRLWLNRALISGDDLGPGDPGDFDHGAWHGSCHMVAASGVRRSLDGRILYLEISHNRAADAYHASVSIESDGRVQTLAIDSLAGQSLLRDSVLLGFIEGNSTGRISAKDVYDTSERFNGCPRQSFDRPTTDTADGGKVWEHWCTLRDIRPTAVVGTSVLRAYITLCGALGDCFAPTVLRGRRDYGHPAQLCAIVRAGLCSRESATWATTPIALPTAVAALLLEAQPDRSLEAAKLLPWENAPRYYMFPRRIAGWSASAVVCADLKMFPA